MPGNDDGHPVGEPARGRPRAEPREAQHARIVAAARRAFTEDGYDGVTMSAIAREANVPRAVVYEVLGAKEDLLGAVADQVADELIAAVDERFSRPEDVHRPLDDVVRDDIRWFVDLIASQPSYAAIIRQSRRLAIHGDDPATRARKRIEARIEALHIARAHAFGVERPQAARVLSVVMLSILESVTLRIGEDGWPTEAVGALVGEFAAGGYLRSELGGAAQVFEAEIDETDGARVDSVGGAGDDGARDDADDGPRDDTGGGGSARASR